MKIKKGDEVKIVTGKDRGKTGKVIKSFPQDSSVLVEGLNMFKKHMRSRQAEKKGEVISISKPVNLSAVRLVCPECHKITRVGHKVEAQHKFRICKKCGKTL